MIKKYKIFPILEKLELKFLKLQVTVKDIFMKNVTLQ